MLQACLYLYDNLKLEDIKRAICSYNWDYLEDFELLDKYKKKLIDVERRYHWGLW